MGGEVVKQLAGLINGGMVREVEGDHFDDMAPTCVTWVLLRLPRLLRYTVAVPRQSLLIFPATSCQSGVLSKVVPSDTAISCRHQISTVVRIACPAETRGGSR